MGVSPGCERQKAKPEPLAMKVALEGGVNNINNSLVVRAGVKLIERRVDNFYGTTRKKKKN